MECDFLNLKPQKILLMRFSSLGDILLVTPTFRALRLKYPHAEMVMVVRSEFYDLVKNNSHLDRVIPFSRKDGLRGLKSFALMLDNWGPDIVIDLHRSARSKIVSRILNRPTLTLKKERIKRQLLFFLRINKFGPSSYSQIERALETLQPLGIEHNDLTTEMVVSKTSSDRANELVEPLIKNSKKPLIAVIPSARWILKCWPEEHFSSFLNLIEEESRCNVVILGGEEDEICARLAQGREGFCLDLHGKTTIEEAGGVLALCDSVITNDTGLLHVAEAVGKDVITIMGPTTSELGFFPHRKGSRVLEKNIWCRPCSRGGGKCWRFGSKVCLSKITPIEVFEVLKSQLKRSVKSKLANNPPVALRL